ncbi:hypothetical protein KY328_04720 [Candidatus Woesearchaeota archaeon]|nr:hypothetical protein [Candidatus Woesearchaeota archaeon]
MVKVTIQEVSSKDRVDFHKLGSDLAEVVDSHLMREGAGLTDTRFGKAASKSMRRGYISALIKTNPRAAYDFVIGGANLGGFTIREKDRMRLRAIRALVRRATQEKELLPVPDDLELHLQVEAIHHDYLNILLAEKQVHGDFVRLARQFFPDADMDLVERLADRSTDVAQKTFYYAEARPEKVLELIDECADNGMEIDRISGVVSHASLPHGIMMQALRKIASNKMAFWGPYKAAFEYAKERPSKTSKLALDRARKRFIDYWKHGCEIVEEDADGHKIFAHRLVNEFNRGFLEAYQKLKELGEPVSDALVFDAYEAARSSHKSGEIIDEMEHNHRWVLVKKLLERDQDDCHGHDKTKAYELLCEAERPHKRFALALAKRFYKRPCAEMNRPWLTGIAYHCAMMSGNEKMIEDAREDFFRAVIAVEPKKHDCFGETTLAGLKMDPAGMSAYIDRYKQELPAHCYRLARDAGHEEVMDSLRGLVASKLPIKDAIELFKDDPAGRELLYAKLAEKSGAKPEFVRDLYVLSAPDLK